jgi:hypothetical protein
MTKPFDRRVRGCLPYFSTTYDSIASLAKPCLDRASALAVRLLVQSLSVKPSGAAQADGGRGCHGRGPLQIPNKTNRLAPGLPRAEPADPLRYADIQR